LERLLGKKKAQATVSQLVARGLAARSYRMEPVRVKPRVELHLSLAVDKQAARQEAARLIRKKANKQAAILELLVKQPQPAAWSVIRRETNSSKAAATALSKKGLVIARNVETKRQPIPDKDSKPTPPLTPSAAQEKAVDAIKGALRQAKTSVFLLHGVTGSGKTEVYLQSLAEAVRLGRRGIVLVPEIALTPQAIERFTARFPNRVAVLHSKLSLGERFDQWRQIKEGRYDVVVGPRSALFAPQPNLGLIVIDEEHEWTYKQQDSPRYHARNAAIKLAELAGATAVLGSATPDVESYYRAKQGDFQLLELPQRVTPQHGSALPQVELVDLREELKAGNKSIFSRSLKRAIDKAIANREQVILFFNRRGGATFIQCRNCGSVFRCKRCQVALGYHPVEDTLICHQCNYRVAVPRVCPRCSSYRIKFLGLGTQKLELEAGLTFPRARLLRWDSDATRRKDSHQEILDRFRRGDTDILIGTQMVAKGLDLPQVTLVGVISADTGLNLPDFRAGERTFQLLSQVTGRAGRGPRGGRAIIQTYSPKHYAIQAAVKHDYSAFYKQEISYRRQLANPPFSRLVRLTYSHTNDALCQREAERMKQLLISEINAAGTHDVSLIGPAPAFIHRLRGRFRWQLVLRGSAPNPLLFQIAIPQGWAVDVDPIGLD
ncbi:MAG: primosomal protein N', partial [Dehalococcoidales bacterium]|nr:primosomal protein N' [Dehalococcoidales bacterium]